MRARPMSAAKSSAPCSRAGEKEQNDVTHRQETGPDPLGGHGQRRRADRQGQGTEGTAPGGAAVRRHGENGRRPGQGRNPLHRVLGPGKRNKTMSRIGKKPVPIPSGVTANVEGQTVKVKGPKGQLQVVLPYDVMVKMDDGQVKVEILCTVF